MTKQNHSILLAGALAALLLPAAAQTSSTTTSGPENQPATINQRKENQQDRVANGVQSGQMTAHEAANTERKETDVNKEEHQMRKLDNGHLTAADRATLNQQQNQLSRQIYRDKHNAAVQNTNPKSEVGKRAENQQDRVAQGIRSGQMTSGEAARVEGHEARINHEIHNDRAANGGTLTGAEKAKVNRQQNRESRQIYREKHNGRKQ
jgi:hypothetical protein